MKTPFEYPVRLSHSTEEKTKGAEENKKEETPIPSSKGNPIYIFQPI